MARCILCKNRNSRTKSITLHSFPKDENKKREWLEVLNIDSVHNSSKICSLHFKPTDYVYVRKRLKDSAVPSVFDLPISESDLIIESSIHNEEKTTFETVYIVTNEEESHKTKVRTEKEMNSHVLAVTSRRLRSETQTENEGEPPLKNVRRLGDINMDEVMKSPEETQWCLEVTIDIINDLKTKIRSLQIEINKLKKKLIDLKYAKQNLKDKHTSDKDEHNLHVDIKQEIKNQYNDSSQYLLQEVNLQGPSTQKRSSDKSMDGEEPPLKSTRLDNIDMDEITKSTEKSKLYLQMAVSAVKELRIKAYSSQNEKYRLRKILEKKMQLCNM